MTRKFERRLLVCDWLADAESFSVACVHLLSVLRTFCLHHLLAPTRLPVRLKKAPVNIEFDFSGSSRSPLTYMGDAEQDKDRGSHKILLIRHGETVDNLAGL